MFTEGNTVSLLRNGDEYFPALVQAMDSARVSIYLETYIFADDASGQRVADALIGAALRGVDVRVVVDSFGTRPYLSQALAAKLTVGGVRLVLYREDAFSMPWNRARLRRLHRKLAMVDARIAFVGGINVIDDHNAPGQTPPRVDFAVRVEGPILVPIAAAANRLWRLLRVLMIGEASLPTSPILPIAPTLSQSAALGTVKAKLVLRDNLRFRRQIENAYLAALRVARTEVVIANAYFLPGIRFRRALIAAAGRGVQVTLILQSRVEIRLLRHATKALYGQLLAGGVRIVEYERSFLHAKVCVVDGWWATVGSSNIDPFSLLLAREANVVVNDRAFAQTLRDELSRLEATGGRVVDRDVWSRRGRTARVIDWLAYGLVRGMTGLIGVRAERW